MKKGAIMTRICWLAVFAFLICMPKGITAEEPESPFDDMKDSLGPDELSRHSALDELSSFMENLDKGKKSVQRASKMLQKILDTGVVKPPFEDYRSARNEILRGQGALKESENTGGSFMSPMMSGGLREAAMRLDKAHSILYMLGEPSSGPPPSEVKQVLIELYASLYEIYNVQEALSLALVTH